MPTLAGADWWRTHRIGGGAMRIGLVLAVLGAGVVLATLTLPLAHPWAQWVSELRFREH